MLRVILYAIPFISFNLSYGQPDVYVKHPKLLEVSKNLQPPGIASGKYPVIEINLHDVEGGVLLNFYPYMKFEVLNKSIHEIGEDSNNFKLSAVKSTISADSLVLFFDHGTRHKIYYAKPVVSAEEYPLAIKRFNEAMKENDWLNDGIRYKLDSIRHAEENMTELERAHKDDVIHCSNPTSSLIHLTLEKQMNFRMVGYSVMPPNSKYLQFFDLQGRRIPLKTGILLNLTDSIMNLMDNLLSIEDSQKRYIILYILNNKLYYSDSKSLLKIINSKNQNNLKLLMHKTENNIENLKTILRK